MIELHNMVSGDPLLINVNSISYVMGRDKGTVVYSVCSEDNSVLVSESYDEVKSLFGKVIMVAS